MESRKVYKYFKKNDEYIFIFKDKNDKYILAKTFSYLPYEHSISNIFYTKRYNDNDEHWNSKLYYMNPYKDTYNKELTVHEETIDDADLCLLLMS